jgi:hypothetical protein
MIKTTIALATIALGTLGWQEGERRVQDQERVLLKEERMTLKYTPAKSEAVILMEAESETSLSRVEVRGPHGELLLDISAGGGRGLALSGFLVETAETGMLPLLQTYPEGDYDIRARTVDGRRAAGGAALSHDLLREPHLIHPLNGSVGVPTDVTVGWVPDPEARAYQVILEQNDNDGITVELPAGSSSFRVPAGILAPDTPTHLEIGAIAPCGNTTQVEVVFTTL